MRYDHRSKAERHTERKREEMGLEDAMPLALNIEREVTRGHAGSLWKLEKARKSSLHRGEAGIQPCQHVDFRTLVF